MYLIVVKKMDWDLWGLKTNGSNGCLNKILCFFRACHNLLPYFKIVHLMYVPFYSVQPIDIFILCMWTYKYINVFMWVGKCSQHLDCVLIFFVFWFLFWEASWTSLSRCGIRKLFETAGNTESEICWWEWLSISFQGGNWFVILISVSSFFLSFFFAFAISHPFYGRHLIF